MVMMMTNLWSGGNGCTYCMWVGGHLGEDTTSECVTTIIINMLACMTRDNSKAIYSMVVVEDFELCGGQWRRAGKPRQCMHER